MLAIGNQVQVIGELHILGDLFQNVDAETFTALLDIRPTSLSRVAAEAQNTKTISRWLVFRSVSAVGKKQMASTLWLNTEVNIDRTNTSSLHSLQIHFYIHV